MTRSKQQSIAKESNHETQIISASELPWYKNAIFYQLSIKSFYDSDDDGVGDFPGLTNKLDYLQDLGVTAIWLMPFCPSPLRDDGYDIADYRNIHPAYGSLGDFKRFLAAAHRRGLRVISELVVNHTSDQHAWFQRARRARPGSSWRDWYVWSDTPQRYAAARIILQDFETSNWTWDPVACAFFWHRFYSHQPDLNYDNPHVRKEITRVLDFWFGLGVDGLKLDGIAYLFEREGTNCENLPENFDFLQNLRMHVASNWEDKILIVDFNWEPKDAGKFPENGEMCPIVFHLSLGPQFFLKDAIEYNSTLIDTLTKISSLPDNFQWALFLRNHTEMSLYELTEEERDYMYRQYAPELRMRINTGIRRRLAPILNNDFNQNTLMNALLFSLPGIPIIYYGEEIGMGDNIYLGDRDGLRTPMQWSFNRNAGFSRCNPDRMFLPVNLDPEYHYASNNAEVNLKNPNSLLCCIKGMIALRRRHLVFAIGTLRPVKSNNPKTLIFLRIYQKEAILVVINLSPFSQITQCDLAEFAGKIPIDILSETKFPNINDKPYIFNLGPSAYYFLSLEGVQTLFHSCFISYSTHDLIFAENLYGTLANRGVKCWFAPEDMKIGDKIRQRIHDSIRAHDKLLLVLSANSINSQWVEEEVESALDIERKEGRLVMFPVRIDNAIMDSQEAWAKSLRNIRHIGDFSDWKKPSSYIKSIARLLRDLKA